MKHCRLGQEMACWLQCWKNLVSFDRSNNTGSIDVKMDGSALEEKSSFKILGLTLSSKLDWGSYVISIAKTASKKIGTLIRSMKFLSPEVALYLYKSTIWPCMEYCFMSGLVLLVATWNCWISCKGRYAVLLVLHCWSVFSIGITLVDFHLNWLNWFHFLILEVDLLVILIDCMIFLSPFLDVTRISMSTVSFLARVNSGICCL